MYKPRFKQTVFSVAHNIEVRTTLLESTNEIL